MTAGRGTLVAALVALLALAAAPPATADLADEVALAERHAPVVRLVEQPEECGPGEPYEPIDVDLLFDEPTVALRGPWNAVDLVEIGPAAGDLVDRYEHHLDFPGDALRPGCDFERWGRRLTEGATPTVYAHVATDPAHAGQLALQYWFFYVYNDWNNLHEGDWEVIQLLFSARDARDALEREPFAVGYSQHEGAERADWDDAKLELVDGRRPVCGAVAKGSVGLIRLLRNPVPVLLFLAALLALVFFAAARATWTPVAPLRVARRRAWGQILSAAARMYVRRAPLFLGLGLLLIPISAAIAVLQWLVVGGFALFGVEAAGESAGALVLVVVTIGTTLTLFGFALVQAATACALVELDAGRAVGPIRAYRSALARIRPLLGALGIAVGVWFALTATGILLPVAIWLAVRWSLLAQVVEVEGRRPLAALRRSADLVRGRWLRVASLVGVGAALALAAGPLLGALLILLTSAPPAFLNLVAGVVYALSVPFVALTTSYVYFDARARRELERAEDEPVELPAEIQLSG